MKISLPILILALTVLSVIGFINHTKTATAQFETISTDLQLIYEDSLSEEFSNWSWGSLVNMNNTADKETGTSSVSINFQPWGGLFIHSNSSIPAAQFNYLFFSIKGTSSEKLALIPYGENSVPLQDGIALSKYTPTPGIGDWQTYQISLASINPGNSPLTGFALQNKTNQSVEGIALDNIFLSTLSLTDTTTTSDLILYDDQFNTNISNWSWGSDINPSNPAPFNTGTSSIYFKPNSPYAALYMHFNMPQDTTGFHSLTFSMNNLTDNQKFQVIFFNQNSQPIGLPIMLTDIISSPTKQTWHSYQINLAQNHIKGQLLGGIMVQEALGNAQPQVFVDDIKLTSSGVSGHSPLPSASMTPLPNTVSPKPSTSLFSTIKPSISTKPSATLTGTGQKFVTLPAESTLPTGEECTALVRRSAWEPRPENIVANNVKGRPLPNDMEGTTDEGNEKLTPRIDGNFVGTTDEIIQWGACKWGFDEETVRAVAAKESWWRQSTLGDHNGTDFESYGLMQVRRTSHVGTYPLSVESVPFNVDYALAWRRSCYEGYFYWIPAAAKGDEWGCIGLWFSGKWYDKPAQDYIATVKDYQVKQVWKQKDFAPDVN